MYIKNSVHLTRTSGEVLFQCTESFQRAWVRARIRARIRVRAWVVGLIRDRASILSLLDTSQHLFKMVCPFETAKPS